MAASNTGRRTRAVQHAGLKESMLKSSSPAPKAEVVQALKRVHQAVCLSQTAMNLVRQEFRESDLDFAAALTYDAARLLLEKALSDLDVLCVAMYVDLTEVGDAYSVSTLLRHLA